MEVATIVARLILYTFWYAPPMYTLPAASIAIELEFPAGEGLIVPRYVEIRVAGLILYSLLELAIMYSVPEPSPKISPPVSDRTLLAPLRASLISGPSWLTTGRPVMVLTVNRIRSWPFDVTAYPNPSEAKAIRLIL